MASAASYTIVLSVVFTASAWLSPSSGASGLSTGKTQPSFALVDGVATMPPPPPATADPDALGTRITASWGDSFVGGGVRKSQTARITPCWPRTRVVEAAAGRGASVLDPLIDSTRNA